MVEQSYEILRRFALQSDSFEAKRLEGEGIGLLYGGSAGGTHHLHVDGVLV